MLDVKDILSKNIKTLRKELGLNQDRFGEITQLSAKAISQIENKYRFAKAGTLNKICNELKISPAMLFEIDANEIKNVSGSREEALNDLSILISNLNNEQIESVLAYVRFLNNKDLNLKAYSYKRINNGKL